MVDEFPVQTRGGSGLKAAKIDKARGAIVSVSAAAATLAFITADGAVTVELGSVRAAGREGGGSQVTGVSGDVRRVVPLTDEAER